MISSCRAEPPATVGANGLGVVGWQHLGVSQGRTDHER